MNIDEVINSVIREEFGTGFDGDVRVDRVDPFEAYIGVARKRLKSHIEQKFTIHRISFVTFWKVEKSNAFSVPWADRATLFPSFVKPLLIETGELSITSETVGTLLTLGNMPKRTRMSITNVGDKKFWIRFEATKDSDEKGIEMEQGDSLEFVVRDFQPVYAYLQSGGTGTAMITEIL